MENIVTGLDQIRTLTAYNYALYDRLWSGIMTLSDEQFTQEIPYSHGSVRNQIVHVARTDTAWLRGLKGDPASRAYTLDPADYPTRAAAKALWDASAHNLQAYVAALAEDDLAQVSPTMPGPVWHVLLHLANHGTDHRAQILRALNDLGAPTFDQDMIFYLWFPGR